MSPGENGVALSRSISLNTTPRQRVSDAARPTPPAPRSPIEVTLEVMGDRFKTLIVWNLFWGARPFCELMRTTVGITKKMLRRELARMERNGLVRREVRPGASRKAEYSLTPLGQTLKPIVGAMYEWGLRFQAAPAIRRASSHGAGTSLG